MTQALCPWRRWPWLGCLVASLSFISRLGSKRFPISEIDVTNPGFEPEPLALRAKSLTTSPSPLALTLVIDLHFVIWRWPWSLTSIENSVHIYLKFSVFVLWSFVIWEWSPLTTCIFVVSLSYVQSSSSVRTHCGERQKRWCLQVKLSVCFTSVMFNTSRKQPQKDSSWIF